MEFRKNEELESEENLAVRHLKHWNVEYFRHCFFQCLVGQRIMMGALDAQIKMRKENAKKWTHANQTK